MISYKKFLLDYTRREGNPGEADQIFVAPACLQAWGQVNRFPEDQAMSTAKAFSLLSGGLDSLLAARLIMDQGIEVIALHFVTAFFGYGKKGQESRFVEKWRSLYGIKARIIDVSEEYFQVVRHPRYGYGKNFNPCVDCKIFLFSKAKALMNEERADFLITGEVLGQRPMSQRRDTLRIVERDSGTEGILLRPLCAKNLKPTQAELKGMVNREKLLAFSGRSRKPQMKLAEDLGLRHYPSPAGGCILTDPILASRIKKYFSERQNVTVKEALLLQVGRHFRFSRGQHLIVGRREEENQRLMELRQDEDVFLKVQGISGPLGLIRGKAGAEELDLAASIVARYSKAKERVGVEVQYGTDVDNLSGRLRVIPAQDGPITPLRF
jgi:tRNA-specific 2-thiouridylase